MEEEEETERYSNRDHQVLNRKKGNRMTRREREKRERGKRGKEEKRKVEGGEKKSFKIIERVRERNRMTRETERKRERERRRR